MFHPTTHRHYLHRMLTIYKLENNLTEFSFNLPKTNYLYKNRRTDVNQRAMPVVSGMQGVQPFGP